MRSRAVLTIQILIPLFAKKPLHPLVPLEHDPVSARSAGQGRRPAGALRAPLTAASTLAGLRVCGKGKYVRHAILVAAGLLSPGCSVDLALAHSAPVARATAVDRNAAHIAHASRRFGIPQRWIRAVLHAESAGKERALSPAGAIGLMQIMPHTWAELRTRHRLGRDPYDPHDNILAGTAYLREMWDRYGDVNAMLAAYNAGPARYDRHLASGRPLPAQTRAYVASLAAMLGGERPSKIALEAPRPPDWREAAKFIERTISASVSHQPSPDRFRNSPRSASTATQDSSGVGRREEIFVIRNGHAGRP